MLEFAVLYSLKCWTLPWLPSKPTTPCSHASPVHPSLGLSHLLEIRQWIRAHEVAFGRPVKAEVRKPSLVRQVSIQFCSRPHGGFGPPAPLVHAEDEGKRNEAPCEPELNHRHQRGDYGHHNDDL